MGTLQFWIHRAVEVVEVLGVLALISGAVFSTLWFFYRLRKTDAHEAYGEYRVVLGRGILLGLEMLVAADIIRTVAIEHTLRSVAVLAVIVVIRTFLSFTLEVELEGRWPWQRTRPQGAPRGR